MQFPRTSWQPANFIGQWSITRQIDDFYAQSTAQFNGMAQLTPRMTQMLDYTESGQLDLGSSQLQATRAYIWDFSDGLIIRYADGRTLIDLSDGQHLCGQDQYSGHITRHSPDRWDWHWRVIGPRKDYAMNSQYNRLTP